MLLGHSSSIKTLGLGFSVVCPLGLEVYDVKTVTYKYGQKIVDKVTKLHKICFSLECFTADFRKFLAQLSNFGFWVADWGLDINFKLFRDFLETF